MTALQEIITTKENQNATETGFDIYRLRVEDYEKMIDYGFFDADDKIELWEGVLVKMSPKGRKHSTVTTLVMDFFYDNLRKKVVIRGQDPIRLDDLSEPEPDIILAEAPVSKYFLSHPTPKEIFLLVEVSDSTVQKDREKAFSYSKNGICQYLLINVNKNEIEDYREPSAEGYRFKRIYNANESFNLVAFPEIEIKVSDFLPNEEDF